MLSNMDFNDLKIENSSLSVEAKKFLLSINIDTFLRLDNYNLSELKLLNCPIKIILEIGNFKDKVKTVFENQNFESILDYFSDFKSTENFTEDIPLESVGLSVRSYNALRRAGYNFLNEVIEFTFEDFTHLRNLGVKSIKEIVSICEYYKNNIINSNTKDLASDRFSLVSEEDFIKYSNYLSVDELAFNVRARNVLASNNIDTLGKIYTTNLYALEALGRTTIKHINDICKNEKKLFMTLDYLSKDGIIDMPFSSIKDFSSTRYASYGKSSIIEVHSMFCNEHQDILRINTINDYNLIRIFIKLKSGCYQDVNTKIKELLIVNNIDQRAINIFIKRSEGFTLEMLGDYYKVQRERIRQIEAKTVKRIKKIFDSINVISFLHFAKKIDVLVNETLLTDEFYKLFVCRLNELAEYERVNYKGRICFYDCLTYKAAENLFDEIINSINNNGYINHDILNDLSLDQHLINYFIQKYNLITVNGLLTVNSNKREKLTLYLKKNLIIDVSKNNINNVMNELKENYGLTFDSERAFIAVLTDVSYSLGGGRYTSLDNNPIIDDKTMEMIFNEINNKKFVKTDILYINYKDKVKNLLSPTHLYLFIKKKYPDKYNYGGVNLVISTKGTKTSQSARVYEHLQNISKPAKRDDLMLSFGLDNIAINVIDQQNDDIIKYGKENYYLKSKLIMSDFDSGIIYNYIKDIQSFYVNDLYKYCILKKLSLIKDNYITSVEEFTSYCCNLESNLFEDFTLNKEDYRFIRNKIVGDLVCNNSEYEFEI